MRALQPIAVVGKLLRKLQIILQFEQNGQTEDFVYVHKEKRSTLWIASISAIDAMQNRNLTSRVSVRFILLPNNKSLSIDIALN